MKNRFWKKVVSFACITAMVAGFTAFAAGAEEAAPAGDITIGISIWSSTDVLGSQCKKVVDQAAAALGVKTQWVDQGFVAEQVTASVETLCAAGCDGIIICNSSDSEMTSAINTCNEYGVYLAQFFRMVSEENSPEVYQTACNSDYFIGSVHEDEVTNGYTLVNILLEKGDRNIGLEGWTVGDATFLERWAGYQKAVDEWNEKNPDDPAVLSEPVYANTSSEEGAAAAMSLYNSMENMDALIVAGGNGDPLIGSIGAFEQAGLTGQIDVVSTDFLDDLAGCVTGLASFINCAKVGSVTSSSGSQLETQIMIALVLGGMPVNGGAKVKFYNIILGALTYRILASGLVMMGLTPKTQQLLLGIIFLIEVALFSDRKTGMVVK